MNYHSVAHEAPRLFRRNRLRMTPVEDPQDLISLVAASSPESRFLRFHTGMAELRPAMAEHLAALTPERGEALGLRTWRGRLVADARYMRTAPDEAEVAILVADAYQGRGLGKALLGVLFERAQAAGVRTLTAEVLTSNDAIVHVLESLVPVETVGYETGARCLRMPLNEVAAAA